jgi:hypothetical protein
MPNPTAIPDLEARFRPLTAAEQNTAQALLDDAWEELLVRIPDLDARMADGRTSAGLVVRVVAAMVTRVLRNPDAIRQWSVDDASFTRDKALSTGFLFVAPEELSLLRGTPPPSEQLPPIAFSASYGGRWR